MKGITVEQIRAAKPAAPEGAFTDFFGERFYRIANYDAMPPFFMTIVSSSDVWNYLWSNGGLTAGRINSDHALFPYYTADKVSDARTTTGPYTAIRVREGDETFLWEPFAEATRGLWNARRNLYKNTSGSKVYFEEINEDLGLTFQYGWMSSERFGLVRHARILNGAAKPRKVTILDGCRNLLSACVTSEFQNDNSVLLDAYKKTDLDAEDGIAIFALSSIVSDKAEPSEGLFANVGWFSCKGDLFLSPSATEAFRYGNPLPACAVLKGERPSFFIRRELELEGAGTAGGAGASWYQVFDTNFDLGRIIALKDEISDRAKATVALEADIEAGISQLERYIADADGIQDTADDATCTHHKANVMFNIMRGGIFADNDRISKADFIAFASERNKPLAGAIADAVRGLPDTVDFPALRDTMKKTGNPQLERLFHEYLPLSFSRRHGDPSRPWNRFSIDLKDARGNRKLNYQGNWRDIFQNWEALALSWPMYLENMTAKFLNATTPDGFNPYRITRAGIDWEVQEPENPWSNIGYWGDHQVIYLAKLLELRTRFDRAGLLASLDCPSFSSGNVPYRLKGYADIVKNPRSTIVFDVKLHERIMKLADETGSDAKLVRNGKGEVCLVSMTAKFLSILCSKMANLVPGGGIWLNTQRPEWNDANNALAGYGLSMVTLCYIRRFLVFLLDIYKNAPEERFSLPAETADFFLGLADCYGKATPAGLATPAARRAFMDKCGLLFERQRDSLYANGYSPETRKVSREEVVSGLEAFLKHAEATIASNRREDGLYHAYNTMEILGDGGMEIHRLNEMLEGQVAVISSGFLKSREVLSLCKALKDGPLFRRDQYSYILYPNRELPHFCAKNLVSAGDAKGIPLLAKMLSRDDVSIISRDPRGGCHFNPAFRNSKDLERALESLRAAGTYAPGEIAADERALHELYEKTFNHRSFTGRSGTFYAYEGLGSIYWHMVSKLLLAVQEYCLAETDPAPKRDLAAAYYDIRAGIGFNKTPDVYGAFPTDPYSHTPAGQGAKQPGMTGQVKEEIITRWGELGITVRDGLVSFRPDILRPIEFHADGTLRFSWCGTPMEYRVAKPGEKPSVTCVLDGKTVAGEGDSLGREASTALLARNGRVSRVSAIVRPGAAL